MRLSRPVYQWGYVLAGVIVIYVLINEALPHMFTVWSRVYVAQPVLWCFLILGVVLASRYGTGGKLTFTKSLLWIGLLLGLFQLACLAIAGLLAHFGDSPYTHTPYGVFLNTVFFGSALVAIEFSRAYLLSRFTERNTTLMVVLIALVFTFVMISLDRITGLDGFSVFPFLGGTLIPTFAENILACFLVMMGGPVASLGYRGTMKAFWWFSPILPQLTWVARAFVGVLAPVVSLLVVQSMYGEAEAKPVPEKPEKRKRKRSSVVGWVATAIVAVVIIWFSSGIFGFHPLVIVSGSMEPSISVGDVVMVRDVDIDSIVVDDVIQYVRGSDTTIHRVVEVRQENGSTLFITQGDANESPDAQPVYPEQIKGRVTLVLPKIGWLSIGIKNLIS